MARDKRDEDDAIEDDDQSVEPTAADDSDVEKDLPESDEKSETEIPASDDDEDTAKEIEDNEDTAEDLAGKKDLNEEADDMLSQIPKDQEEAVQRRKLTEEQPEDSEDTVAPAQSSANPQ